MTLADGALRLAASTFLPVSNSLLPLGAMVLSVALLLAASEVMVGQLRHVGLRLGLPAGTLGLLVALGADAPEVSSAMVALAAGSSQIGLGVVEGSNIYNLAGLLGLSTLLVGTIRPNARLLLRDGGANCGLTVVAVVLVVVVAARIPLALVVLAGFGAYGFLLSRAPHLSREAGPLTRPLVLVMLATGAVIGLSTLLVDSALAVVRDLHVSQVVVGIFILPISTSLPNTWAAIRLAQHNLVDALVAATFNSNSINVALGIALPSLFIRLHPTVLEQVVDGPYLIGMTGVVLALTLSTGRLTRVEGAIIVALYAAFVVVRLVS